MNINKDFFNNEYIYLGILFIFSLICTIKMASFCLSGGILNPDSSLYLISALKYAGMDYYGLARPEELFYTPIISFLTSLIFRLGFVDRVAIIIVTSILCFLGYIGLYQLLKIRFNPLLSLTGVIIYGSTSVVIFNLSKGLIDIPSICISIWALYFAILAIDKNPKYFVASLPLLVIGFFTKYIAGFILPLIILYYLMSRNFIDNVDDVISDKHIFKNKLKNYVLSAEFKYILISIFISLILAFIICKTLILDFGGSLTFFQQTVNTVNVSHQSTAVSILDKSFYFDEFPTILFEKRDFGLILTGVLYGIFGISIIIQLLNFIKKISIVKNSKNIFKTKYFEVLLLIILLFSIFGVYYGFKVMENNMISNISFLVFITVFHALAKKLVDSDKCSKFTVLYVSFFVVYFIFLSLYSIKLYRYGLPLIAPFACIMVWSLDTILNFLNNGLSNLKCNFKTFYQKYNVILVILCIVLLVSTLSFVVPMEYERSNDVYQEVLYKGYSNDLVDVCDYIADTDSNYHSKTFAAFPNSSRTIMWYLNVNVTILDEDDPNLTDYDNSTYLILYENIQFNNYHEIYNCGDFYIYYHN